MHRNGSRATRDGRITEVTRLRNTHSGNPRWRLTWLTGSGAEWANTKPDAAVANTVTPDLVGQEVRIVTDRDGVVSILRIAPPVDPPRRQFRKAYSHSPAWSDECAFGDGQCDGIVAGGIHDGEVCGCGCHRLSAGESPTTVAGMAAWHVTERRLYGPVQ